MSIRRLALGPALFVLAGSSIAIAGCGSNTAPTAKVFLNSQLTAGTNGSAICGVTDPTLVVIGSSAASADDGSDQSGVGVKASCSVTANADGSFQVNAIGVLGNVGSVTITGKFTTSGEQTGIRGVFQSGVFGRFEDTNCTVSYKNNPFMGVAAGRVWGNIDCPSAADSFQSRTGADGGPTPRACEGLAEFKFENCAQ